MNHEASWGFFMPAFGREAGAYDAPYGLRAREVLDGRKSPGKKWCFFYAGGIGGIEGCRVRCTHRWAVVSAFGRWVVA